MNKYIIVLLVLISLTIKKGYSQSTSTKSGTAYLCEFKRIDSSSGIIMSAFQLIIIDSVLYSGTNFPFDCAKCKLSADDFNSCINLMSTIDEKSINKANKKINKGTFSKLYRNKKSDLLEKFTSCLITKYGNNFIVRKHILSGVTYAIINCEEYKGVGEGVFCHDKQVKNKVPVIYRIKKVRRW